jgi:nitric oxide reductase NorD protein
MEEFVGNLWHKIITRAAYRGYPDAAVHLADMAGIIPVFFRALGGDPGLSVRAATATAHGARRSLLQRLAGSFRKTELAWQDDKTLYLPASIELFPERALNRDLYLWLAALASCDNDPDLPWFTRSQQAVRMVLTRFPGWQNRYQRLVAAALPLRPDPARLKVEAAAQELAIRAALLEPGSVKQLPAGRHYPVYLWLHPHPPLAGGPQRAEEPGEPAAEAQSQNPTDNRRRHAERTDMPDGKHGFLLLFRAESLFSWTEYLKVNRPTDEDDRQDAERAADDLDVMSVARDNRTIASRLRFDLDLPPEQADDLPLNAGILLPEWHYQKRRLQADYCRIQPLVARQAIPCELPESLRRSARHLKQQLQALLPLSVRLKGQLQGDSPDIDAYARYYAERGLQLPCKEPGLYQDTRKLARDLACLLLADLSLSTDAWLNNNARVIDIIRDSLLLFAEALSASGDRFGLYGFSSIRRHNVRLHVLKAFQDPYNAMVRGRIMAIKPGFYTRMGAAIRYATRLLAEQQTSRRLLLILTDGKPNDLDQYEGRYGIEDTRMAVLDAKRSGLTPFCVTIDRQAGDYLPHLFGPGGFVVVRKASELPRELPLLYAQLTR